MALNEKQIKHLSESGQLHEKGWVGENGEHSLDKHGLIYDEQGNHAGHLETHKQEDDPEENKWDGDDTDYEDDHYHHKVYLGPKLIGNIGGFKAKPFRKQSPGSKDVPSHYSYDADNVNKIGSHKSLKEAVAHLINHHVKEHGGGGY